MQSLMKYAVVVVFLVAASAATAQVKQYNLFLVSGQSNAVGSETDAADLTPKAADANIPFWFDCGTPPYDATDSSSGGTWTTLGAQPQGDAFVSSNGGFGPEMSIGRDLYSAGVPNVAMMKFAYGATTFRLDDWNKGDTLYDAMLGRFQQAKAALEAGGNTVTLKGLFWIQGESDSGWEPYDTALTNFIANVRADYGVNTLPAFFGFKTTFPADTYTVVADQKAVAAADANAFYVDTDGAEAESEYHFSSAGTLDVGSRFAAAYLENYPVPEPATMSLLALGGLAALIRRRRK